MQRRTGWLGGLLLSTGAVGYGFQPLVVSGNSMAPTLRSGQVVSLDRTAYLFARPRRGEVVVFRRAGRTFIKRVYACAGDLVYHLGSEEWSLVPPEAARRTLAGDHGSALSRRIRTNAIPRGTVFVVGDNAQNSEDSRDFGPVPLSSVVGRVRMPADESALSQAEVGPGSYNRPRRPVRLPGSGAPGVAPSEPEEPLVPVLRPDRRSHAQAPER